MVWAGCVVERLGLEATLRWPGRPWRAGKPSCVAASPFYRAAIAVRRLGDCAGGENGAIINMPVPLDFSEKCIYLRRVRRRVHRDQPQRTRAAVEADVNGPIVANGAGHVAALPADP